MTTRGQELWGLPKGLPAMTLADTCNADTCNTDLKGFPNLSPDIRHPSPRGQPPALSALAQDHSVDTLLC